MTPNKTLPVKIPDWLIKLRFNKKNLKKIAYALFGIKLPIRFFPQYRNIFGDIAYVAYKRPHAQILTVGISKPTFNTIPNYNRWAIFIHELAHVYDTLIHEYKKN